MRELIFNLWARKKLEDAKTKIFLITGWRTALVDGEGGQRARQTPLIFNRW